jgi:hypothetical protein
MAALLPINHPEPSMSRKALLGQRGGVLRQPEEGSHQEADLQVA